jgi:protein-S-isoprenylcysteine O-methyltransferase Ste14
MILSDIYFMIFISTVLIWLSVEMRLIVRDRKVKSEGGSFNGKRTYLMLIGVALAAFLLYWFTDAGLPINHELRLLIGTLVIWGGLILRWSAIYTLGKYFNVIVRTQPDQEVVKTGPYRFMRHPSYTGSMLVYIGLGLSLGNVIGLAVMMVLPFIIFYLRAAVEERIMVSIFGEYYRNYMRCTPRFIFIPNKYTFKKNICETTANE